MGLSERKSATRPTVTGSEVSEDHSVASRTPGGHSEDPLLGCAVEAAGGRVGGQTW